MQSFNVKALDAVDPSVTNQSTIMSTRGLSKISLHAILTGTSSTAVTVEFYVSNEDSNEPSSFVPLTTSVSFTSNTVKQAIVDCAYRWVRIVSTNTASTSGGALTVYVFGNGQN